MLTRFNLPQGLSTLSIFLGIAYRCNCKNRSSDTLSGQLNEKRAGWRDFRPTKSCVWHPDCCWCMPKRLLKTSFQPAMMRTSGVQPCANKMTLGSVFSSCRLNLEEYSSVRWSNEKSQAGYSIPHLVDLNPIFSFGSYPNFGSNHGLIRLNIHLLQKECVVVAWMGSSWFFGTTGKPSNVVYPL